MQIAQARNRPLQEVLEMPFYEVQMWIEYLSPEEPDLVPSVFDEASD